MGAYLSEPVKEKTTEEGSSERFHFAATSMQGWRVNQEDAHNAISNFSPGTSLFAVYDGHGGPEVSQYVAERFPSFLREQKAWREGRIGEALTNGFLDFDAHLTTAGAMTELKRLAGHDEQSDNNVDDPEETADEGRILAEEARMPIEELFEKYGILGKLGDDGSAFISPNLGRRTRRKLVKTSDVNKEEPTVDESASDKEDVQPGEKRRSQEVKENGENVSKLKDSSPLSKRAKMDSNGSSEEGGGGEDTKTAGFASPRQRSSKSESDVRTLRAEEEATGPLANWKAMGVKGGDGAGRETPETATAASSGDEKAEEEEEESEEDESYVAPADADGDEDEDDSEEDDDEDSTQEDDEESEEDEEEDEEGDEVEICVEGEEEEEEFAMPSGDTPGVDSGTTACVVVLSGQSLYVANAGDSRCVLCREGKAVELSEDHKPEDEPERARIVAAGGKITPDGRVNGGLNLSRALGDHFYKRTPDLPLAKQMISPLPDIRVETLTPQDRFFVLACDGIWNSMESQEVVDFVSSRLDKGESLKAIAEAMCDHCLAPDASGDGTGCDNMTVIICHLSASLTNGSSDHSSSTPPPPADSNGATKPEPKQ